MVIEATQGIVVGPGSATIEMRLIMIHPIDVAVAEFSAVAPTVFMDDVGAEIADEDDET